MYLGEGLSNPVVGGVTGVLYPFNQKPKLLVDNRDMVFMLGQDFTDDFS